MLRYPLLACALYALLSPLAARANVPSLLSFQGVLKSPTGAPLEGAQSVRFSIYNAPEGNQAITDEVYIFAGGSVALSHSPVVSGSDVVKKTDGTVTYARGVAYTINNSTGVITSLAIPDGTSVKVTYQWIPTAWWTEDQTVQATRGLFSVLLGVNAPIPPSYLTGYDWLGIEVKNGATWQPLSPRLRLASVAYAMRVASLDGASGGTISGGITSTDTVAGTGRSYKIGNFPVNYAGIQGNGVTGLGGDAPGVLAIGANNTGLALKALGKISSTGDISAPNLTLTGNATVQGNSNTYGNGQVSGLLIVGNLTAAGTAQGATLKSTADTMVGQDLSVTRNATVNGAMTVTGGVTGASVNATGTIAAGGTIAGRGALKPDFDSGLQTMPGGTSSQTVNLPAALGTDPYGIIVDFLQERPAFVGSTPITVYAPPSYVGLIYLIRNDGTPNLFLDVWREDGTANPLKYRFRVWKLR